MPPIVPPKDKTRTEHIGVIERAVFTSASKDWTILTTTEGHTVIGPADGDHFPRGTAWKWFGRWEDDPTRGPRFRFATFVPHLGAGKTGVVSYLTRTCDGIGNGYANRLWDKYGPDAVKILREEPDRAATECNISPATCRDAAAALDAAKRTESTRVELFGLFAGRGFPGALIERVIDEFDVRAPQMIRKNPFVLLDLPGGGFKRLDKLWCDLGLPKDALKRAGICAANLVRTDSNGHTWLRATDLAAKLRELVPGADAKRAFKFALRARKLKKFKDEAGVMWLATYHNATAEERIAANLRRLSAGPCLWPTDRVPVSKSDGDRLPSAHQVERLTLATAGPVGLLLGGPGTGKSHITGYLLREIVSEFGASSICVAAPTGKAAVRATQAIAAAGLDIRAKTMHSTLEIGRNGHDGDGWGFQRNRANPLDAKFYVLDECFVRGTKVDTPNGPTAIESISVGDEVYSAAGVDIVYGTSRKAVSYAVRITAGEASFISSEGHAFFTARGWVRAIDLRPGETLVSTAAAMRLLRHGDCSEAQLQFGTLAFLRARLRREMVDAVPRAEGEVALEGGQSESGSRPCGIPSLRHSGGERSGGTHPTAHPHEEPGDRRKDWEATARDRAQADCEGRERERDDSAAAAVIEGIGRRVEGGTRRLAGSPNTGIPYQLQIGSSVAGSQDWRGDRRPISQPFGEKGAGCQEGCEVGFARVDRVEVLQQGHPDLDQFRDADGKLYLYDLAVARHPSFSVGGCLVHNCSMVDASLAADFLDAIPDGGHVLGVGDPSQLPPVGHGAPLRDLIDAGVPHGELTEVRRNAGQIVHACVRIKNGESFDVCDRVDLDPPENAPPKNLKLIEATTEEKAAESLVTTLKALTKFDPVWQTQVIVARNKKGQLSRVELNKRLHPLLNPDGHAVPENPFKVGDKIICLRNSRMHRVEMLYRLGSDDVASDNALSLAAENYDTVRDPDGQPEEVYVANGEIGRVVAVAARLTVARFSEGDCLVKIPMGKQKDDDDAEDGAGGGDDGEKGAGCNFDLAYAISCHKCQGSEAPCVIVMGDDAAGMLTTREWLYTAISRASKLCILIGRMSTFDKMRGKRSLQKRKTFVAELVREALNGQS